MPCTVRSGQIFIVQRGMHHPGVGIPRPAPVVPSQVDGLEGTVIGITAGSCSSSSLLLEQLLFLTSSLLLLVKVVSLIRGGDLR